MDPLNDKIQELTAKYEELSSRSGVGKSSVVKVVMGSDGIYSDERTERLFLQISNFS